MIFCWNYMLGVILILITLENIICVKSFELNLCYNNFTKTDRTDMPRVFDSIIDFTMHVSCHYCAKDDYYPKLWFYKERDKQNTLKEVQSNNDNIIGNRISISLSHTLTIQNFKPNDSGVYTCKSYENNNNIFTYVLEGIMSVQIIPKTGVAKQQEEYKETFIDTINKKFQFSLEEPFISFRNHCGVYLNVYTVWDDWSECRTIDGFQKGIRKKLGRCRIRSAGNTFLFPYSNRSCNRITSYLTDGFDIPCRSMKLYELIPEISQIVKNIPEFETHEVCSIIQNTDEHNRNKETSMYKTTQEVMENDHVMLPCIEVFTNSEIKWFKDKKLLKPINGNILNKREDEPRISIDGNNTLHLLRISKTDEGIYTCSVSGKKVKQIELLVLSKSKLLNQEFIRYSIYLGFVLSLTVTCYCAGVCVAWHRRASFMDPLNLYKKKPYAYSKREHHEQEKLLN